MTAQPLSPPAPIATVSLTWAAAGVILTFLLTIASGVAAFTRLNQQVVELHQTTEPIRRGDLVRIQTDVAWIRHRLEREEGR